MVVAEPNSGLVIQRCHLGLAASKLFRGGPAALPNGARGYDISVFRGAPLALCMYVLMSSVASTKSTRRTSGDLRS